MPFVKSVKTNAFFSRYQVKWRRRREGKTDYQQRRALTIQDKNKYDAPKYRLVVRITHTDIICQIVYTKLQGDVVMTAAYAHELPRYGMPVGLTNYSAAYATGLLVARRHLKSLGLDEKFAGTTEFNPDFKSKKLESGRRPFKALLDVGLARTTTGSRIFAAMKGAVDGGLKVPHSNSRLVGYDGEKLDGEALRAHIFGGHVASYMRHLQEEDAEKFQTHFSQYIKSGITADNLVSKWEATHKAIRANPAHVSTKKADPEVHKRWNAKKLTLEQRKAGIQKKLSALGYLHIDRTAPVVARSAAAESEEQEE